MIIVMGARDASSLRWKTAFGLVALAVGFAGMLLGERLVGALTIDVLRALDMLSPHNYYTGTPIAAEPALWLLSILYLLPLLPCAAFSSPLRLGERGVVRRIVDFLLMGIAVIAWLAVVRFAFDPRRTYHRPLVERWDEFSYEAADIVLAATWVMVIMCLVFVVTSIFLASRRLKLVTCGVSFVVLTPVLGALFA